MTARSLPRNALVKPRARHAAHHHDETAAKKPAHPWWPWTKRILTALFFLFVTYLLVRYARNVAWDEVWDSLTETPAPALAAAIALAAVSHTLYSCFDLIGKRYTGHDLTLRTVMSVNFISYAFNLCIGSLVGGVAFRYRLYSQLGLSTGVITRIVSMSMLTNWLGYKLLAGFLFIVHPLPLPPAWHMGNHGLQWIGALLVAISLGYIVACWRAGDRVWTLRGHELYLPPWRMAVLQMTISCINWCLMAGVIHILLGQKLPYSDVLTVLLIGAIAGVVAHVPAGLGVFEFVFIGLLAHRIPESGIIAALLGYRAIYYIGPLVVATLMYVVWEAQLRGSKARRHKHLKKSEGLQHSHTRHPSTRTMA